MYKDEQLREAQAWIARVREMDVFQSTTNQTLQAELRERTEQYNQLWMGFQRQVDFQSLLCFKYYCVCVCFSLSNVFCFVLFFYFSCTLMNAYLLFNLFGFGIIHVTV